MTADVPNPPPAAAPPSASGASMASGPSVVSGSSGGSGPRSTAGRRPVGTAAAVGADVALDVAGMVGLAQALVRVPSVFDPGRGRSEEPAAELLAGHLRGLGWSPRLDLVAPGRPNVLTVVEGGLPGPTLMFEGHTDVVTEGDPAAWAVDPFGGEVRDGRLWGRGAADMKAGLAAAVYATKALAEAGPFPGRIVLAALVDEEGMMLGAKHLVATGGMEGVDAVVCCEPEGGEVCHVAKGALRLRIDLRGVMAHGAMPFAGRNPNRAAARVIAALGELEAQVQLETGSDEYLGLTWLTPTVLRAGDPVQMNVMPADAALWVDVRTTPAVAHGRLLERVRAVVAAASAPLGVDAEVQVIDDRPSVLVEPDAPIVRALREAAADLAAAAPHGAGDGAGSSGSGSSGSGSSGSGSSGSGSFGSGSVLAGAVLAGAVPGAGDAAGSDGLGPLGPLGGVPGATDGTVLTSRTGVPSVVCGPGGKWIAHQVDEFVELADIERHARLYVAAARRFLGAVAPA